MAKIYNAVDELIGATPRVRLNRIEAKLGLNARLLAKLEYFNPAGSVKDRVAKAIIDDAEQSGRLLPGGTSMPPSQVSVLPLPRIRFTSPLRYSRPGKVKFVSHFTKYQPPGRPVTPVAMK